MARALLQSLFAHSDFHHVAKKHLHAISGTAAGVDGVVPDAALARAGSFVSDLQDRMLSGRYRHNGLLAIPIPKPGKAEHRIICVPTVFDRLVQRVIHERLAVSGHAARTLRGNKVAFGVKRGVEASVAAARCTALRYRNEFPLVYKADITKYFDRIDRDEMKVRMRSFLRAPSLFPVIDQVIDCEITSGYGNWKRDVANAGIVTKRGLRQGMPLSPLLSTIYLGQFDHLIAKLNFPAIRYVDDLAVFLRTGESVEQVDHFVRGALEPLGLDLPELNTSEKCRAVFPDQDLEFLGMTIRPQSRGGYSLEIPDRVLENVSAKFAALSSIARCAELGLTFRSVTNRIDATARGYRTAYAGAANWDDLDAFVADEASRVVTNLLAEAFGQAAIDALPVNVMHFFEA